MRLQLDPNRLREQRIRKALSRAELAERARVHADTLALLERGVRSAKISTIRRLAEALDVEPSEISTFEEAQHGLR